MDYVSVLKAKREEVWQGLEAMRDDARRLAEAITVKEAQLRNLDELLSLEDGSAHRDHDAPARSGSFLDEAERVINESESGLHYRDLLQRLNERGVNVPGRDPAANLIAHMTRDARFVRTARGTYGLAALHEEARPVRRRARSPRH